LKQAHQAFREGNANLACLQAPLVIDNYSDNWLASMFAIEYSALFDGLLPVLGHQKLPLPLGGSSNHFKRRTLVEIGAWDPYNVTEDADLGLRLARAGCVADVLTCPTYETAPVDLDVWMRQRTRWFKGWYQTFLVHTRQIGKLRQDLGMAGFFSFQLMTVGMTLSALINPFLLFFVVKIAADMGDDNVPTWKLCLLGLDIFCIIIGHGAFIALASRTLALRNMSALRSSFWMLPIYWLLMSAAAWRALWQLFRCPHKWEKTPHLRRQSSA
jgi:cellulose synthase/poly-beta-1,6-N-acetylglucosamine synthase-like glycosyltransferase